VDHCGERREATGSASLVDPSAVLAAASPWLCAIPPTDCGRQRRGCGRGTLRSDPMAGMVPTLAGRRCGSHV